jgi:uncharacterized protein DUF5618
MTKMQKKQLIVNESMRYIDNALETLKTKAKPVGDFYEDQKYVKAAGHYAYHGVLYALNQTGLLKLKKGQRPDVKDYRGILAKENRKMLHNFNLCYETFHLSLGYDGIAYKKTLPAYIKCAEELIQWAANKAAA